MEGNKKNTLLLTVIAIATLLVAVVGATFAYFSAQLSTGTNEDVTIRTHTDATLTYNIDKAINIVADTDSSQGSTTDFTQATGSTKSDTATGTVSYKGASTASSSACYTVQLNTTTNDFEYTKDSNTPELTLTVTKKAQGDASATTVIDAMDITTNTATIYFPAAANGSTSTATKHTISSANGATSEDVWTATVSFIWFSDFDQSDPSKTNNAEKSFDGSLVFTTVTCD